MKRWIPHWISFCIGFVSLGMEIVWVRLVGFVGHTTPQAFTFVLSAFLIGIAAGAALSKKLQRETDDLWLLLLKLLNSAVVANLSCVCFFILLANFAQMLGVDLSYGWISVGLFVALDAMVMAAVFPIVHHIAATGYKKNVGRSLSFVYGANILGSALGPLCVGFFLIDAVGTQQTILILQFILPLTSLLCLLFNKRLPQRKYTLIPLVLCLGILTLFLIPPQQIYMLTATRYPDKIIETSRGIISVYKGPSADAIYGGNVYDGTTNLDPIDNSNGIDRILITAALCPHPSRILVIGLASGSWVTLLTTFPGLQSMDVVEINNGYLELIQNYPLQQKALKDPRVHIHIADGRQWLREHGHLYDLIVMNTSHHWRSYSTNLLSIEMMRLANKHLASEGVFTFNTTGSADSVATAAAVFPYTTLRKNFVIAGNFNFLEHYNVNEATQKLLSLKLDGHFIYGTSYQKAQQQASERFLQLDEIQAQSHRKLEIITQDNMLTEFKYGMPLF